MLCKSNDHVAIKPKQEENVIFSRIKNMIMRRKNSLKKSHVQESHYDQIVSFYLKEFMTTVNQNCRCRYACQLYMYLGDPSINQSINFIYPRIYSVALKC